MFNDSSTRDRENPSEDQTKRVMGVACQTPKVDRVEEQCEVIPNNTVPQESQNHENRNISICMFWENSAKLWFIYLENEFRIRQVVSDDIKYSTIIRHLNKENMAVIADNLEDPPQSDKYNKLKAVIIERFSDLHQRQLRGSFKTMILGEKSPSSLLREMQTLAGTAMTEAEIRVYWIQKLPKNLQDLLEAMEDYDLDKLANCADKAYKMSIHQDIIAATKELHDNVFEMLNNQITELKTMMQIIAIRLFGQVSPTKLLEDNELPRTSSVPGTATPSATIFPLSSSTSSLNSNKAKATTLFGVEKPPVFATVSNRVPTLNTSSIKNEPSIFGTSETMKMPGFNTLTQTSVVNSPTSFGTASNTTSTKAKNKDKVSKTATDVLQPSRFGADLFSQQSAGDGSSAKTSTAGAAAKPLFTVGSGASTSQRQNVSSNGFAKSSTKQTNFSFNLAEQKTPISEQKDRVFGLSIRPEEILQAQTKPSILRSILSSSDTFDSKSAASEALVFTYGCIPSKFTGGLDFYPSSSVTSTSTVACNSNSLSSSNINEKNETKSTHVARSRDITHAYNIRLRKSV